MAIISRYGAKKNQAKESTTSKHNTCENSIVTKQSDDVVGFAKEKSFTSEIWNINSILSNIFKYTRHKDLVEFNTVCKKWHQLTNPIIHKSMKLVRGFGIINKIYDEKILRSIIIDAEVDLCISNNSKFAPFVQKINYYVELESQKAISFFQTFRFVTNLAISSIEMDQDQILGMIQPLTHLKNLFLNYINVKNNNNNLTTNAIQLPLAFKKLSIDFISLAGDPILFIQSINSHQSLEEFYCRNHVEPIFLEPFIKPYPSLKIFEYSQQQSQFPELLNRIYEANPQLTNLKLN
jgi:hypothetical protein